MNYARSTRWKGGGVVSDTRCKREDGVVAVMAIDSLSLAQFVGFDYNTRVQDEEQ